MRSAKFTFILLVITSLLTACGLKGALYLPEQEQTTQAAADLTEMTEEQIEKEEETGGDF